MLTARDSDGGGPTPKIDMFDRPLHDGERGIIVLCGRREHSSGGGGLTPMKGIEHRERKMRVST